MDECGESPAAGPQSADNLSSIKLPLFASMEALAKAAPPRRRGYSIRASAGATDEVIAIATLATHQRTPFAGSRGSVESQESLERDNERKRKAAEYSDR